MTSTGEQHFAEIGRCEVCERKGLRIHHVRRFGNLGRARAVCVDEQHCLAAFIALSPATEPAPPVKSSGKPVDLLAALQRSINAAKEARHG